MNKRQRLRKFLIIFSFILFPVTFYYLSPYLIIMGASEGIINGSLIIFSLLFLTALFFGRGFCGWICPAAGVQEALMSTTNKKGPGGKANWIKWLIWVPWIAIIAMTAVAAGGYNRVEFLYATQNGISATNAFAYITYYSVVGLIILLQLTTGKRSFCHTTCWMAPFMILGTKFRNTLGLPGLRLHLTSATCTSCNRCNKNCPMSLDVVGMVNSNSMDNLECILCGNCIDACTRDVIKYGWMPQSSTQLVQLQVPTKT